MLILNYVNLFSDKKYLSRYDPAPVFGMKRCNDHVLDMGVSTRLPHLKCITLTSEHSSHLPFSLQCSWLVTCVQVALY